jgi:organic radical activating enzyme
MKKIPIKIISTRDSNTLHVRFWPTDICNFKCSYCFPGSGNIDKFRYPKNIDTVVSNFRLMFDMYQIKLGKTKFHIFIEGGGEPTLWPHIEQFCKEIKENHNVYISVVSNGSRTLNWWGENYTYFDDVVLSTHHEFVDIDHHCDVADLLYSLGVKVTALMLMDAKHWDKCTQLIERMKQSKKPWFIQAKSVVAVPGYGIDVYTDEQVEFLKLGIKRLPDSDWILKHFNEMRTHESVVLFEDGSSMAARPYDIITNKWNHFKDWQCNVTFESLLIRFDGTVTGSCQESIFKDKNINLFSEDFEEKFTPDINFVPVRCSLSVCNCQPETHITKSKVE